jgi:hypothetical protein
MTSFFFWYHFNDTSGRLKLVPAGRRFAQLPLLLHGHELSYTFIMEAVHVRFIIGQINEADVVALKEGHTIVSKMILPVEDFSLFRYHEGDAIEAETHQGNRVWCTINHMEILKSEDGVIIIFTLELKES